MNITVAAVGTRGDVEPHSALCRGLMEAGYRVQLCAPVDFAASAKSRGIPFCPIPVSFLDVMRSQGNRILSRNGNGFQLLRDLKELSASVSDQVNRTIREACKGSDAVCYSTLGLAAQFFADEMGIPAFATFMQPLGATAEWPSLAFPLPRRTPRWINRASHLLLEEMYWQLARPLLKPHLREAPQRWRYFRSLVKARQTMLFAFSPAIVAKPEDWPPCMHVTGYWRWPSEIMWQPPIPLLDFLAEGDPPVCIGFGSMVSERIPELLRAAIGQLTETGRRAIVLTGWSGCDLTSRSGCDLTSRSGCDLTSRSGCDLTSRSGCEDLTSSSVYVMDSAPHDWLFPRVSCAVHHGGAGTTAAALHAGTGSVIVPFFFDQKYWGRRLEEIGLGPPPISFRNFGDRTLRRTIDIAESKEVRRRVSDVSRRLRMEDGVANAVETIEACLKGSPVPTFQ